MGKRGSVLSQIQSFDAYAKTLDDFRIKTYYGAACMSFIHNRFLFYIYIYIFFFDKVLYLYTFFFFFPGKSDDY